MRSWSPVPSVSKFGGDGARVAHAAPDGPRTVSAPVSIRAGSADDLPILEAMLFEAFHWNPDAARPERASFQGDAEFAKLLRDWGTRDGDTAVIAETRGGPVGAAWYRFWTRDDHSYGFVDARVPEVGMGVDGGHRSRGVGRALLAALLSAARSARVPALSLSVDPANFALRLYESAGFRRVGGSGTSLTLLRELGDHSW